MREYLNKKGHLYSRFTRYHCAFERTSRQIKIKKAPVASCTVYYICIVNYDFVRDVCYFFERTILRVVQRS